jgi:hypothetical protein
VDFILLEVDQVEVVFAQLLQVADIFIADGMPLAKSRPLEFARTDLRDIMGQVRAHGLFDIDFL